MAKKLLIAFGLPLALAFIAAACGDGSAATTPVASGYTLSQSAAHAPDGQPQGISVSGQGRLAVVPDVALLDIGVSTQADTARQARDRAEQGMNALLASLDANGIAQPDIQTTHFSISPRMDYPPDRRPVIIGYEVTNTVRAKVRDLDSIGKVIDDAVDAVGDPIRVQSVSFTVEDPTPAQSEARALAMADARAKAEELAQLAAVGLGKPIFISESAQALPVDLLQRQFAAAEGEAVTPIEPGQLEVVVNLQVTFAIQ